MSDPARPDASVFAALSVHLEPLAKDARVLVVGAPDDSFSSRLEELGARSVYVSEPEGRLDVRDGAFDLAVVPDFGVLPDPSATVARLRRVVDARGAVVAMARARADARPAGDAFPELAMSALGYAELYDAFSLQFEHVSMTGVVPFRGVVFAELGQDDADVGVSVDARLARTPPPEVFVVVASREGCPLESYAIVQVEDPAPGLRHDPAAEADLAALQLKADLLAAQLDEQRGRVAAAEARANQVDPRLAHASVELEAALARAAELETTLAAKEQTFLALERRVSLAERGTLERDERVAILTAELDAARADATRADAAARDAADLAVLAEAHAAEIAALEAQLRDRARVNAALERELVRREQMIRELVMSIDEPGAPVDGLRPARPEPLSDEESDRLRRKLDELAMEVARREGELRAQAWRVTELENAGVSAEGGRVADLERELDALRQALRQEHALVERLKAGRAASGEDHPA